MMMALTGGIGCGKSTALQVFQANGCACFDTDLLCREILNTPAVTAELSRRWGADVCGVDGRPDRKRIAAKVFADPAEMDFLTGLLYPGLQQKLAELRKQYAAGDTIAVVEVPLLYEQHLENGFDAVVAVWSDFETRRERLAARGWDDPECERREALQWSPEQKLETADLGIINQGSPELLFRQCAAAVQLLQNRSSSR